MPFRCTSTPITKSCEAGCARPSKKARRLNHPLSQRRAGTKAKWKRANSALKVCVVSELGLGCMGMTFAYGPADENEAVATIHRALALGVNFFDTAEVYGPHTNERLVGRALRGRRDEAVIATKFGFAVGDATRRVNGTPENAEARCGRVARAARYRRDRSLLPAPARSVGADRRDGRRNEGARRGGQSSLPRALGGVGRDVAPRACGSSDQRAAERIFAVGTAR